MTTARSDDDPVDAEVVDTPGAQVVQLHKNTPPPALEPVHAEPVPEPTSRAYQLVKRAARPLPHPRRAGRVTWYWTQAVAGLLPWMPVYAARELKPIFRGLGRVLSGWARWVTAANRKKAAREGEPSKKTALLATSAERAASARMWGSAVFGTIGAGGLIWVWNTHPGYLYAAAVLLVAVLDVVGRAATEPAAASPPAMPRILSEDVPLRQVEASVLAALEREGFPPGSVGVAEPMWWDETRRQYEISLSLADQLRPEHLRAVERAIGARDHSIRNLATDTATLRKLIIRVGDPIGGAQECAWIPTGTLSFADPLPLGRSSGETPMEVRFLGAHCAVVGRTRSGKTEGLLWTLIDRLAACRDVIIWGIDLQAGPAFPLWRGVIQRVAYTADDALALLEAAIDEMGRRKKILTALAESDDEEDEDAGTVWTAALGAFLEIIIDEFALTATFNGQGGRIDLLSPLEEIIRTGLKFGVHLILATQKTGNSDFGSSVMQTQIGIKILLSCRETDTVTMLDTAARDAGWSPHLLQPAQDTDPADAGKCYISGPAHTTPDIYRADYWPRGSVKPRARRRLADGLPTLSGARAELDTLDAVEVPPVLVAVEAAFRDAGDPEKLATAELLAMLADAGWRLDEMSLADALRPAGVRRRDQRWRPSTGANPVRGYWLADVHDAIRRLS